MSLGSYGVYVLTTYTFRLNNTNALSASSLLRIIFPSQIGLESSVCKINGVTFSFVQSVIGGKNVLNITLNNSAIAQYGLYGNVITLDNVRNPDS